MHERVNRLAPMGAAVVSVDEDLAREFEARLVESATLAFRVAYGVLRQREDAEDVAQEAMARAYRQFRQLRDRERFRAWLVRMTWRMAIDRQRSDRRRHAREQRVALEAVTVTAPVEGHDQAQLLWQAIDTLSDKLRIVTVLAAIEGHDMREVATLLELPEGTVKSRLFMARQQLKERLSWMAPDRTR